MKNSILKTTLYTGLIIVSIVLSSFTIKKVIENKKIKTSKEGFAVLELFTSQGCSSCPPADAVLGKYAIQNNPNVIALAFHVDYWNYIGWKDPFSKAQFTDRQRNYANLFNAQGIYTPQLIINGKYELVGSKENEINNLINKELEIKKELNIRIKKASISNNLLNIEYDADINSNIVVNLALVKKKEFTSIKRGENNGLKQTNYNIVYDFKSISNSAKSNNNANFQFKSEWLASDFMVIAYLQNTKNGNIIAAAKNEIN
ncbi:DUF1223 domain-containing protein [Flavobacterium soyangense]|uniref:DUF1223 domain-containing protein n=1 Tax=Flavobacterium soyangense TaxID=2023265 RepID=A0A930U7N4_9FLAO|nr:DUF1223 domain-containing protein [Flavobacterium soyangense]MBF2708418.1 DUF1223 domain-containing protein [Flavobacterium soyangense]